MLGRGDMTRGVLRERLLLIVVFLTVFVAFGDCRPESATEKPEVRYSERSSLIEDDMQPRQMALQSSSNCKLVPVDSDLPKRLKRLIGAGDTHLVKYQLSFPEYDRAFSSGGVSNGSAIHNYKTDVWYRVFSSHGLKLLTMPFNFDAISLTLLSYGVEKVPIAVIDSPPQCFGKLTEDDQMWTVMRLLMRDLKTDDGSSSSVVEWNSDADAICHQVIENDDGNAKVVFRCCSPTPSGVHLQCVTTKPDDVIKALYAILCLLKVGFVLFGPVVLQRFVFGGSTKRASYVIPIAEEGGLHKTILVKKVRAVEDEAASSGFGRRKDMKQFTRFRKLVKTIPSEAIVPVKFNRLDILVDHTELMTEDNVPVGLFRFIYETFLRCEITRVEPLKSCCQESIFGSWSPRFLWLKLRKRCDCNRGCRDSCSWSSIFKFLGGVLQILLIPFPYYVRLAVFYKFERDEIKDRRDAYDHLGLDYTLDHNLIQWLTPTHAILIVVYIVYLVSALALSALRICDSSKIDGIARACVTDMRHIRPSECLRMLCAHILLPFEKFGICGVLVAAIYWPIVLPVCLLVAVFYCVPLLYLAGRLLVSYRPTCCRKKPLPTAPTTRPSKSLSAGVTSFDSCFFLDTISPDSRPYSSEPAQASADKNPKVTRPKNAVVYRQRLASGFGTFLVGLLMIVGVCSVLLMYAEAFGFLVEALVLAVLGAIANSDRAMKYVVLVAWAAVYVVASCYQSYIGYTRLSRQLFGFIKTHLCPSIQDASLLRQEKRRNTAFKYFTNCEAVQLKNRDLMSVFHDETDIMAAPAHVGPPARTSALGPEDQVRAVAAAEDSIEYRENRLHWIVNSLVLFVDKNDVSRIPLDLFWEICKLDMPGSPGPIHQAALKALGRILCSLLFLGLFTIVVLTFGNMYDITTTNQMILLLISGGIPLFVCLAVYWCCRSNRLCINEYSLRGKVQRVILGFTQSWPVYDLSFQRWTPHNEVLECLRCVDPSVCGRSQDVNPRGSRDAYERRCDCVNRRMARQAMDPDDHRHNTELKSHLNGSRRDGVDGGTSGSRFFDSMQVDLLITVREDQEDENIRSEPVSLGSGMSINSASRADRTSPDDSQAVHTSHATSHGIANSSGLGQSLTSSCVTNQPTNASRSRMAESVEALEQETTTSFALRKQSSVSTLPVQNHVTSVVGAAQADVVLDMTEDAVFAKRMGLASPRNTVSMRSLPSYKHRPSESTSESAL